MTVGCHASSSQSAEQEEPCVQTLDDSFWEAHLGLSAPCRSNSRAKRRDRAMTIRQKSTGKVCGCVRAIVARCETPFLHRTARAQGSPTCRSDAGRLNVLSGL